MALSQAFTRFLDSVDARLTSSREQHSSLESEKLSGISFAEFTAAHEKKLHGIIQEAASQSRYDIFFSSYERPSEYEGPAPSSATVLSVYFTNIGRAVYGSDKSPGIIAVHYERENGELKATLHSDMPSHDPLYAKIKERFDAELSSSVQHRPSMGEKIGEFYTARVQRLADLLKSGK